jgi:hypothetical protein
MAKNRVQTDGQTDGRTDRVNELNRAINFQKYALKKLDIKNHQKNKSISKKSPF